MNIFGDIMLKLLLFSVLAILFLSCSNEDKLPKDATPEQIVTHYLSRTWQFNRKNQSGIPLKLIENSFVHFEKNGSFELKESEESIEGKWSLEDNAKIIKLMPRNGQAISWEIHELNKENFRIRYYSNEALFEYAFVPK